MMMMIRFRIDGGNLKSTYTDFCVGFPPIEMTVHQVLDEVKGDTNSFYHKVEFSRIIPERKVTYPTHSKPGDLRLNCCFGNGKHSRGIVILSQKSTERWFDHRVMFL